MSRHPHGDPHEPIPGGSWIGGRLAVEVSQGRRVERGVDPRVFKVAIVAPSGMDIARMDLETMSATTAIATARLMCVAPRLAQTLHDVDVMLEREGMEPSEPERKAIREALEFATTVPLSCL